MQLITNSVAPNKVEEKADHYLIKSVPFVRAQELSGGYVPEWSIKQTANEWVGKKATLNHPRDNQGQPVPARTKPKTHLGEIVDSWFDGEFVRANIRLKKSELQSANAKAIQAALKNGKQIHVSSQYHPRQLPSGEYDGEFRQNAEAIAQPDSVAVLPSKKGKCDIQDGCGINPQMVANAAVSVPMTQNATHDGEDMDAAAVSYDVTNVNPGDVEFTDSEWDGSDAIAGMPNPSEDEDAPEILDQTHAAVPADDETRDSKSSWKLPFRTGPDAPVNTRALVAIDAALDGARGGVEGLSDSVRSDISEWVESMLSEAPDDMFGAGEDMEANTLVDRFYEWLTGGTSTANSDETTGAETGNGPESPVEDDNNDMDRDELISEIVSNSKLTKSALEERCDEGLEAIHSDVTENMSDNNNDNDNDNGDKVVFESQAEFEERVEEIVANRVEQDSKEDLATEIVANSNDYEDKEKVLEDFPTEAALKAKKDSLQDSGTMPAGGITGNGVEIEANDDEFDVSGGVLTDD